MGQRPAKQWLHVLLPVLRAARRPRGDAPTRALTALAPRLGVVETAAAPRGRPAGGGVHQRASAPPCAHDGPERRLVRPQDPVAQTERERGKQSDHTGKNVLLVPALLRILLLSDTSGGRVQDKRMADATPSPFPAGRGLGPALGFLAFTLPQVEILMPTKQPRGEERTLAQQRTHQALHQRRLRIAQGHRSVKRWRVGHDRLRLWQQGVRDRVMDLCGALRNFRVRLNPWPPMA